MNPQDTAPGNPRQQLIERLRSAVNVLVTVSNNPSVDQLSAAIAFTLFLNKLGKHATAVFSGQVPSTVKFLKPEATIESNTDSLRDFIISLDKSKADKLRYKVEDNVVRIFITPYHTSLSEKDLDFSQGDFNVDAVVALGVTEREHLDQAITAHGRILHDATVITLSTSKGASDLGGINWQDMTASSLCEMLVGVGTELQSGLVDSQIATAYLTGIVAETDRFRNAKTTPAVMSLSAQLMSAGANQQLIASELDKQTEVKLPAAGNAPNASADGSLTIAHEVAPTVAVKPAEESTPTLTTPDQASKAEDKSVEKQDIEIDEQGNLKNEATSEHGDEPEPASEATPPSVEKKRKIVEPLGNSDKVSGVTPSFTSISKDEDGLNEPLTDPLTTAGPTSSANNSSASAGSILPPVSQPEEISTIPPAMDDNTLRDVEKNVVSQHIANDPTSTLDEIEEVTKSPHQEAVVGTARDAVASAIASAPYDVNRPEPLKALNANPIDLEQAANNTTPPSAPTLPTSAVPVVPPTPQIPPTQPYGASPTAPPPVPPPFLPKK